MFQHHESIQFVFFFGCQPLRFFFENQLFYTVACGLGWPEINQISRCFRGEKVGYFIKRTN